MEHGGPYVSKIENRNRHVEIVALARALDMTAEELMGRNWCGCHTGRGSSASDLRRAAPWPTER